MASQAQRAHMLTLMDYLLTHERQIHYRQARPMSTAHLTEAHLRMILGTGDSIAMDCSEAVTLVCRCAGLHDPNGMHFDGYGNSGSMHAQLPHYAEPLAARVGALVTFGPAGSDHVAMVHTRGADPLLWSHGAEAGPRVVRYSAERDVHRSPATFLSVAQL